MIEVFYFKLEIIEVYIFNIEMTLFEMIKEYLVLFFMFVDSSYNEFIDLVLFGFGSMDFKLLMILDSGFMDYIELEVEEVKNYLNLKRFNNLCEM